jgi:predicted glycoside hydrolase/deacetylase ChbG (UPF0249 family)
MTGKLPQKFLIVTADDLGLSQEINHGILTAHREGIVTSAALLVNAPATAHALELINQVPKLEIGLHLAIVESLCLSEGNSIQSPRRYFNNQPCLHENWKSFLWPYLRGSLNLDELEAEMRLQIEKFLHKVGKIPFLNATQHLHLLPGVAERVAKLCQEYNISAIRNVTQTPPANTLSLRLVQNQLLMLLGRKLKGKFLSLKSPQHFLGFPECGQLNEQSLKRILVEVPIGCSELMTHPGFDCPQLRQELPENYNQFFWHSELEALTSKSVRENIEANGIKLVTFTQALEHEVLS